MKYHCRCCPFESYIPVISFTWIHHSRLNIEFDDHTCSDFIRKRWPAICFNGWHDFGYSRYGKLEIIRVCFNRIRHGYPQIHMILFAMISSWIMLACTFLCQCYHLVPIECRKHLISGFLNWPFHLPHPQKALVRSPFQVVTMTTSDHVILYVVHGIFLFSE